MKQLNDIDRKLLVYLLKQGEEQNSYQSCDDLDLVEDCGLTATESAAAKRAIQQTIDPDDEDEVDVSDPISGEGNLYRYFIELLKEQS